MTARVLGPLFGAPGGRYVRADALAEIAARPVLDRPPLPPGLVLRVGLAEPDLPRRPWKGWRSDLDDPRAGVLGFWQLADETCGLIVDQRLPIVVAFRTIVVDTFGAVGWRRTEDGVVFDPVEMSNSPYAGVRVRSGRGGATRFYPPR
ncbi:hypothetical protein [Modestobacter sp. SYSU DS0511]